jgi:hypothetical protein
MSYDVEAAKAAGHSDEDIANHLAQSHGYDVLGARKEGFSDADIIKHLAPMEVQPEAKQPSNIALPAELGLLGGAGATAFKVGDIGLKGTRNVVKKVEQLLEGLKKPEAIFAPHPTEFTGPKTPVDKYGKAMHGGVYSHAQDMGQMYKAGEEAQAFKSANPAWEVRQGSSIALPPDLKASAAAAKTAPATTGLLGKAQQMAEPIVSGVKSLGAPLKFAGKFLAPIAGAFEAGMQGGEAINRGETGDKTGAVISGLGSLGSAAMMSGNPLLAVPGAAVSLTAPQVNKYRDLMKQGRIRHEAPNYQNFDEMGNAYAHGGLVNLANGGESNTDPFIGYPNITNKPRDPKFVQQSGPVLGGLDAVLGMGKRDDVSMLTPEGQAYHESYDKYEPVGIAANVLPFIGGPTKALGKATAKHLGPKAADMAENYLTKIGGIQHIVPPSNRSLSSTKIGEAFDPRYDPRKLEQEKLQNLTTKRERYQGTNAPEMSIVDMEGHPFVTQMADRSGAGHYLQGINDVNFKRDVDLMGGQDFMLNNPIVWTSTPPASKQTMKHAQMLKEMTGKDPYLVPWRMGPQGSDFAHMTGETQLAYSQAAMGKAEKQLLDQSMKNFIPDWKGIDSPESMLQFKMLPSKTRKAVQFMIDKDFRNKGGLGIGEARLAIADPSQVNATWGGMQNVGKIFADKPMIKNTGHWSYPGGGIPGEAVGTLNAADQQRNIYEMLPKAVKERGIKDPTKPSADDLRALQMKPYTGIVTDKLLKGMGFAAGGKVLSALGKSLGEAQAAYKAKFTPGFYHGSPSNSIKAFDTQAERNPNFLTALEEESNDLAPRGFVSLTNNPKFSNDYATGKNATVYPVSANLGKHFDPRLPENYDVFHQYRKSNPESFPNYYGSPASLSKSFREAEWSVMEDPSFLEHLKNKGYNSMTMIENGQPNVGVFNPADIRGKFAKFNPEHAADPDFMKAAGGAVEGYAPGGKVLGGLAELLQLIKNQGGAGAAQRLERAADLVPNLEHQYQPQALKEAFSGNRSLVSVMNPADFEKYAAPISSETKSSLSKSRRIGEPGPGQDYTHMPLGTYDDYIKYLQQFSEPGGGGFRSMPYLQLGQRKGFSFPNIQGHEGRHRTDALTRQGNQSTLVGIEPRPELRDLPRNSQEEYLNALSKEVGGKSPFVMPQESEVKRGLIELPEMFKKGGLV